MEVLPCGTIRVRVYAGSIPSLTATTTSGRRSRRPSCRAHRREDPHPTARPGRRGPQSERLRQRSINSWTTTATSSTSAPTPGGVTRLHPEPHPPTAEQAAGQSPQQSLDSFYLILHACRAHCSGLPYVEHGAEGSRSRMRLSRIRRYLARTGCDHVEFIRRVGVSTGPGLRGEDHPDSVARSIWV